MPAVGIETTEELMRGDDAAFDRLTARFAEDARTGYAAGLAGAVRGRALAWAGQGFAGRADESVERMSTPALPRNRLSFAEKEMEQLYEPGASSRPGTD